jgi:DNA-binding MarR family transcriptional regulator
MPPDLHRLVQALRAIQMTRGQLPWRYLDLTMAQLKAVMLLCRTGRARSRALADGLGIAPSAATPLVDRLVEQKLARREDDPADRRIVWILPTRKAEAIYDELLHTSQDVLEDVIGEVPAKDRKAVRDSVQLLADAAARVLAKDKQRR